MIPKNTKVTQFATEIPPLPQGPPEYLRMDFISATTSFFYHMERESRAYSDILQSFQKFKFTMDCDHMALTLLRVIYAKFYQSFKTCKDSVVVMKQMTANDGSKRLQSINNVETLMGNSVTQDKGHVIDFSEDYSDIDYAILVYNRKLMDEMIHQSMEADSPPVTELESLSKTPHDSHFHFGPVLQPCFVPRRRLFFLTIRGESVSLFLYNVNAETTVKIKEIVERALYWNNARSRLLREIGLHKMQITHLSTLKSIDPKVNFYQLLTWRDPELLITHDYPPENIKTADFAKIPKKYARMFLKIYRFSDPSYVLKQNTTAKFDDQIAQMLSMREEIKEMLSDFQLFGHYHNLFLNPNLHQKSSNKNSDEIKIHMDEDVLMRLLTRCEEAHYVQTPLLLFPEWRKKVAAIRAIGTEFGSIGKRKHSAPAKGMAKKQQLSLEPKMKPRSKTVNVTMLPTLNRTSSGEEPCSLKIQFMLAQEYTNYLVKNLGAKRLFIQSTTAETRNNYAIEYTQSTTVSPIVWLYLSYPGGFILLHLSFIEPYFCLRILFWNRGQLFEDQSIQDLRSFIKEKNQIISKCHLHSFTYDFHLRMVKTYLVGGTQLLFNRGYNTTAFLIDFLQYYSCRPPSARNCIYEENCPFDALKVPGTSVWENFLDKESKYGWKVVRLKNVEKDSSDEFMLVSEASKKVFDQEYEGVRVITNVLKGNTSKDHKLLIRYYVIMVSRDTENPLLDALYTLHDPIPPGEFKRLPTELYPDLELEDEFPLDFDVAYDSDARQSSGSNSDKSQRHKNRQSMQSIASLASGNNSNDRLSDFDPTPFRGGYVSPCPSPMSQTLVDFSQMTPLATQPGYFDALELKNKLSTQAAMIQKVPPRGHRKNASISSELRIQGAIPPEQVTYVHYFNNLQKKLQLELEEFARASKVELEKLVQQADRECHVEMVRN
uniref:Uncharacterized protein n=1 Tax=Panagrolaimus superbus TaxID=310955 RepID=A0A914YD68_9BILA